MNVRQRLTSISRVSAEHSTNAPSDAAALPSVHIAKSTSKPTDLPKPPAP